MSRLFSLAAVIGALLFAERASRAYKDIKLLGCKLLAPGGLLMTYSCSGGIGLELFQKIVAGAALASSSACKARRITRSRWRFRRGST